MLLIEKAKAGGKSDVAGRGLIQKQQVVIVRFSGKVASDKFV